MLQNILVGACIVCAAYMVITFIAQVVLALFADTSPLNNGESMPPR